MWLTQRFLASRSRPYPSFERASRQYQSEKNAKRSPRTQPVRKTVSRMFKPEKLQWGLRFSVSARRYSFWHINSASAKHLQLKWNHGVRSASFPPSHDRIPPIRKLLVWRIEISKSRTYAACQDNGKKFVHQICRDLRIEKDLRFSTSGAMRYPS